MSSFTAALVPLTPNAVFRPRAHAGELVLLRQTGVIEAWVTPGATHGQSPRRALVADVVVLDDDPQVFERQVITSTGLMRAVAVAQEPWVLGRLVMGTKAWLLTAPSDEDSDRAQTWLDEHGGDDDPPLTPAQATAQRLAERRARRGEA